MESSGIQINEQLFEKIEEALSNEEINLFRAEFLEMHPYDQAELFVNLPEELRFRVYTYLSPDEVSNIMENIDIDTIETYFSEMNSMYASKILAEMSTDDAVDILNMLDKNKVAGYLTMMEKEPASEIKELLHYQEKTAGSIMTNEYVVIHASQTVKEAMRHLRKEAPQAETIYYNYVVDDKKKLVGVISLRDLIIAEGDWQIADIMSDRVVSVDVGEDQEEVAHKMRDYDFLALPVVDFQQHLLGIITVDDIIDVMEEEASDDYSKLAAISDTERPTDNSFSAAKKRLPWLVILSFLGMLTASLIGQFETTLDQVAVLAIFIPLIAGMAGNTGTQALAVAVRGIATGDYGKEGKWKLIVREAGTGFITGICCGLVITLVVFLWKDDFYLGLLVGISIMATLVVATLAGSIVPLIMHRFHIDPAVASGPFITTINDIISILIYFGMANAFMNVLIN